jgi:DMSO reductase anchor subunit
MISAQTANPVDLMQGVRQTLWGKLAVANFVLGGLGAGVYLIAAVASGLGPSPDLTLATLVGPALVLAGFVAVGLEAGSPLRGLRVLRRVATSWMSRELWLGAAFVLFAVGDFVHPALAVRLMAVVAALGLSLAQGSILRAALAVPNWSVALMPLVFAASALVSGSGLITLIDVARGQPPGQVQSIATVGLLLVGALVWQKYGRLVRFAPTPREGWGVVAILAVGYVAPIVLELFALAQTNLEMPAAALAGVLMVGGQIQAKALLILSAGEVRPIRAVYLRRAG